MQRGRQLNYDALLLVSFGGPEGPDDVIPFLERVLKGRRVPRERMMEVAEHYHHFGGVSPINGQNRALISALEVVLETRNLTLPVYWGNRNWHPLLPDTVRRMAADGIRRALAFVTSPYSSWSNCRQYLENIEDARRDAGPGAPVIEKIRPFFNHPGFIETMTARVRSALDRLPEERRPWAHLVYTAHSIPMGMAGGCAYEAQLREASRLISGRVGASSWALTFQSRSGPPTQPWLEPDVCDYIRTFHEAGAARTARAGKVDQTDQSDQADQTDQSDQSDQAGQADRADRDIVVIPVGFISDHMEVAYDLDVEARACCDELGVRMVRAETAGTHPRFVDMIVDLVEERMSPAAAATSAVETRPAASRTSVEARPAAPARPAEGVLGPWPDRCPLDCCPPGR
ncbi:MAG: ferrochelatase [Gemmatimonadetes bacterium]|nr:ferrochelatase [Gemmatimonadota bacterium]